MSQKLSQTPLHPCHLELGARMVPFAGFELPVQYSGVLEETKAVRKSSGLFDVSHMGQLVIRGKKALQEINKLVTNNLEQLSEGQAQYNILCNPEGGTIDDLIVYYRKEDEIFICVNAANRKADCDWIRSQLPSGLTFEDISDATALIALQGPQSESLISQISDPDTIKNLKYFWAQDTEIAGCPCFLSRTGYTGEDGFELYLANEHAIQVWQTLMEKGKDTGLVPVGLGARDTLRLEMGYVLHGHELSPSLSPLAAGLSWAVKLNKETPFVGQAALQKEKAQKPAKKLKAFTLNDRRIPRAGYPIVNKAHQSVGMITSGTFSPHLNCAIALGYVDREALGEKEFFVRIREIDMQVEMTQLPFVPSHTKSAKIS